MSRSRWSESFAEEKAAWLAVAEALRRDESAGEPDPLLLAAWIEGRLDETEAAPVERWIATDPAGAASRIAILRSSLAEEPPAVPQSLLMRLRAMAPSKSHAPAAGILIFWYRLPQALAFAAAVTLGVFGAYGGYELGMTTTRVQEQVEVAALESPVGGFYLTQEDFFFE